MDTGQKRNKIEGTESIRKKRVTDCLSIGNCKKSNKSN